MPERGPQDCHGSGRRGLCAWTLHASNIFLREIPQVRMSAQRTADRLLPLCKEAEHRLCLEQREAATVLESTLAPQPIACFSPSKVCIMAGQRLLIGYIHPSRHARLWWPDESYLMK